MRILRAVRYALVGLIVVLIVAGGAWRVLRPSPSGEGILPPGTSVGGAFTLTDAHGQKVTDATFRGRWMLVYFGYTNCPDDCPLTMQHVAAALHALGPLADKLVPVFISVDPRRDTPPVLAAWLAHFDTRIVGLTGTDAEVAQAAKAYRVYYSAEQHEASGADLVSHSSFLYLMDPEGRLVTLTQSDLDATKLAAMLRARLAG